jgi:hypothetical protein
VGDSVLNVARELVQGLKLIVNQPEEEIFTTLRECGMDLDVTVNRLLPQGTSLVNGGLEYHQRDVESALMGCSTPGQGKTPLIMGIGEHGSTPKEEFHKGQAKVAQVGLNAAIANSNGERFLSDSDFSPNQGDTTEFSSFFFNEFIPLIIASEKG